MACLSRPTLRLGLACGLIWSAATSLTPAGALALSEQPPRRPHPASTTATTAPATRATSQASLYSGGDILTMAGPKPTYVEALVEKGGRIVYILSLIHI